MHRHYGLSNGLFVSPKNGQTFVVGGMNDDSQRWTRVLSQRAGYLLWLRLAQQFAPEQARHMAGLDTMEARDSELPTITHHVTLDDLDNGQYELTGWVGDSTWSARMTSAEAGRLLHVMDDILHTGGNVG
jgi:hypothetical protein